MDQAVQVPGRLLNLLPLVVIAVQIKYIRDEIKRILVVLDLRIQACQVESIGQIILIDFAEVLISARRDELHVTVSYLPTKSNHFSRVKYSGDEYMCRPSLVKTIKIRSFGKAVHVHVPRKASHLFYICTLLEA